ncbi:hypothetical protein CAP48_06980 [Advenella sp. S44]|nr:hypothetical protein CAP48_06980 [Advenella sp. S44]
MTFIWRYGSIYENKTQGATGNRATGQQQRSGPYEGILDWPPVHANLRRSLARIFRAGKTGIRAGKCRWHDTKTGKKPVLRSGSAAISLFYLKKSSLHVNITGLSVFLHCRRVICSYPL